MKGSIKKIEVSKITREDMKNVKGGMKRFEELRGVSSGG